MIDRICPVCGKTFQIKPNYIRRGRGRFCSMACFFANRKATGWRPPPLTKPRRSHKGPRLQLTCAYCGKGFEAYPCEANQRYCSLSCKGLASRTKQVVPCVSCGKPVERHACVLRNYKVGAFCSKKCVGDYTSTHQRGPNHPHYKDGLTPSRYPREFEQLRGRVMERDGHKCRLCGGVERLLVHHADNDPTHNVETNLVTVCFGCHRGPIHSRKEVTFDDQGNPIYLKQGVASKVDSPPVEA